MNYFTLSFSVKFKIFDQHWSLLGNDNSYTEERVV